MAEAVDYGEGRVEGVVGDRREGKGRWEIGGRGKSNDQNRANKSERESASRAETLRLRDEPVS